MITSKAQRMITRLRILRRSLNEEEILKVITSQYFGQILYAIAVWYSTLTVKFIMKIGVLHFKALRVVLRDWMRIFLREMLDLLGRQRPAIYSNYMVGSVLINCYINRNPSRLYQMIKGNEYHIRQTGTTQIYDSSIKRVGQQAIQNQLDEVVKHFNNNWTKLKTKDYIRIFLKKTFFA